MDAIQILNYLFMFYSISIISIYFSMCIVSLFVIKKYKKTNDSININTILASGDAEPSVTIIASSFNESPTIIPCVISLLNLEYNNYEVIVVNDGSTDDSLEKVITEFNLEKIDYIVNYKIETKKIRGIYKSKDSIYRNLIIIDKENGGKADAMNAGINISSKFYIVCVDVDSILRKDGLLKLIKSIISNKDSYITAVGATVCAINACKVENGVITEENVPNKFIPAIQIIEYLRAFLMGRIALGKIKSLILVSGAIGMFKKDNVLSIGGYDEKSIGEDMELIVRIRKYLYENETSHNVDYIPDPLLWTEVPSTYKILGRQRTRWARGLVDTLRLHKYMLFNKKYKTVGFISFPYFVFFEWLTAFIEMTGLIYMIILFAFQMASLKSFFVVFFALYLFNIALSYTAILLNEVSYHSYGKSKNMIKLMFFTLFEAIIFHPITVYWTLKGNYMYLRGVKEWGVMTREGFK